MPIANIRAINSEYLLE